jgi:hypothetical protein
MAKILKLFRTSLQLYIAYVALIKHELSGLMLFVSTKKIKGKRLLSSL